MEPKPPNDLVVDRAPLLDDDASIDGPDGQEIGPRDDNEGLHPSGWWKGHRGYARACLAFLVFGTMAAIIAALPANSVSETSCMLVVGMTTTSNNDTSKSKFRCELDTLHYLCGHLLSLHVHYIPHNSFKFQEAAGSDD